MKLSKRILLLNIIFYTISLIVGLMHILQPEFDLGWAIIISGFWFVWLLLLIFLRIINAVPTPTTLEKIGFFTAMPVLASIGVLVYISCNIKSGELTCSSWLYEQDGYEYMGVNICESGFAQFKRTEFYKHYIVHGRDEEHWVKDGTWLYFSASGDTIRRVTYKDDVEIK